MRALVAMMTDFGTRDPYVASMKGVILSICDAEIIDLTHEIRPFDVFEGAWFLRVVASWYPRGPQRRIVFVGVIDPGVGTSRRILAARSGARLFVGPDNGLLSIVLDDDAEIVAVENEVFFLPEASRTFHGRDRFAPLAAALANGIDLDALGPRVERDRIVELGYRGPVLDGEVIRGTVVSIDRFGNVVTDVPFSWFPPGSDQIELTVGGASIRRVVATYEEGAASDGPFLIQGSLATVEISIAEGSAAEQLQTSVLDPVEIRRIPQPDIRHI